MGGTTEHNVVATLSAHRTALLLAPAAPDPVVLAQPCLQALLLHWAGFTYLWVFEWLTTLWEELRCSRAFTEGLIFPMNCH